MRSIEVKETYKRYLSKRPIKNICKRDMSKTHIKGTYERHPLKRFVKETYRREPQTRQLLSGTYVHSCMYVSFDMYVRLF